MATSTWNQDINAGSDWEAVINILTPANTNRDITGCTLASKAKRHYTSAAYQDLGIVVNDAVTGAVKFSLTAAQTTIMKNGKYLYDVELTTTATGMVERVIQGVITIRPEVT